MRVTVRLFARLRDIAGSSEVQRHVPASATAEQIWRELAAEFPDLDGSRHVTSVARNREYVSWSTPLAEGDEVAFLPPVSGG
jgi:molybdopterin converting factor subunit 1